MLHSDKKLGDFGIRVYSFFKAMRTKIVMNRDKIHWKDEELPELKNGLLREVTELVEALDTKSAKEIQQECADVANYAFFIYDKLRG